MTAARFELLAAPLRAVRRAAIWWSIGLAGLVLATVAFWPAFKGSSGISQAIDQLPPGIVEAFGLRDFGSPAGFLRGNLYEVFVPLLLAFAAIAFATGQTASEEASGRLELVLALPVDRRAVFVGRALAALVALLLVAVVLAVAQVLGDALVGLVMGTDRIVSTIVLSTLLAALYGSVAIALAGITARPSLVLGVAIGLAIAGYVVAALFPLSSLLEPWRHLSPWDWAFTGDPLEHATEPWRYLALAIPTIALTAIGVVAVSRRDIAAA